MALRQGSPVPTINGNGQEGVPPVGTETNNTTSVNSNASIDVNANGNIPLSIGTPMNTKEVKQSYFQSLTAGLMTGYSVTANLLIIKEKAEEILKTRTNDIKVMVLDKNSIPWLAYSCIVFYKIYANNLVRYYTVLYTKSGRMAITAKQTVQLALLHQQERGGNKKSKDLYTYSDAMDEKLQEIIIGQLKLANPTLEKETSFQSIDGQVLRYNVPIENVVGQFVFSAFNAFVISEYEKEGRGLNLPEIKKSLGNKVNFIYNLESNPAGVISDKFGNPVKADFIASINLKDNSVNSVISPNSQSMDQTLVTVAGYIAGIPVNVENREKRMDQYGRVLPFLTAVAPNIVITYIDAAIPDTASALLGLIAATLVAEDKQYIKIVMDTMTPDRQPGIYNLFTREAVDSNGNLMEVDVCDKKLSPNDKALLIDKMFQHEPLIILDATLYNQGYEALSAFVFSKEIDSAKAAINKAASILTDGAFTPYAGDMVFSKTIIPAGSWRAKDSERDIRDLEFEAILRQTNGADETAINIYFDSIVPNNQRAFDNKIELLSTFIEDAEIENKTVRMLINPQFVLALSRSLGMANIRFQFENKFVMPQAGYNVRALRVYADYGLSTTAQAGLIYSEMPNIGNTSYNSYGIYSPLGMSYKI